MAAQETARGTLLNGTIRITALGTSHGSPTRERFNTSTLVEIPDGRGFLVDAGTPVLALLIRKGFQIKNLKAVFITHMHQDHFGGIPDIMKYWVKILPRENRLMICLPEDGAAEKIFAFTELAHREIYRDMFDFRVIDPEDPVLFPGLKVNGIRTDHFSNENLHYPSYAVMFEHQGKKILHTGDLSRDFHDFPVGTEADMAFCELTHYPLGKALPILAGEKFGKLVFTHIGNEWHGQAAEAKFRQMVSGLPYPAVIAHDGDEFDLR